MEKIYIVTVTGNELCPTDIPGAISHAVMDDNSFNAQHVGIQPVGDNNIILEIAPIDMLTISCSIGGMMAELHNMPSKLEDCLATFKVINATGAVDNLADRLVLISKREVIKCMIKEMEDEIL